MFASRAWLINTWGSTIPYWDAWDAEPMLYQGWLKGTLTWHDLFAAHNEHRIVFTRLSDLAIFALSGEWSIWTQLLLNALLHAVTAGLLVFFFEDAIWSRTRCALATGITLLFSAPSGWYNALYGFQSQVYFTNLLTVLACAGIVRNAPLTRGWWLGWLAAAAALFSNAGGRLIAPAVWAACIAFPDARNRRLFLALLPTSVILLITFATHVSPAGHVPLHAHTAAQFTSAIGQTLSWPFIDSAWMWIILQLPIFVLSAIKWKRHIPLAPAERCAVGFAAFAILHAAAIAYSRGGRLAGFHLLSRYHDPMLIGTAAQLLAGLQLARDLGRSGRLVLIAWTAVLAFGLLQLSEAQMTFDLPYNRAMDRDNFAVARVFIEADPAERDKFEPMLDSLHPNPSTVRKVLEDPLLKSKLPPLLRNPMPADANTAPRIIRWGYPLFVSAAFLFVVVATLSVRRKKSFIPE